MKDEAVVGLGRCGLVAFELIAFELIAFELIAFELIAFGRMAVPFNRGSTWSCTAFYTRQKGYRYASKNRYR